MESDIRYYRRRAYEEMSAAGRAVTDAARQRRLQLVDMYVQHLKALNEPDPFDEEYVARALGPAAAAKFQSSAFAWPGTIETPAS